jgi:hypothetical protein
MFGGGADARAEHKSAIRSESGSTALVRTADDKGRELLTPFHFQRIARRGSCRKTGVVAQNRRPRPELTELGVAKCVFVVDTSDRSR